MANVLTRVDHRDAGAPGGIYLFLFPIPVVCFVGALITDITYASSAFLMWLHFSQWLIAAGIAFGIVVGIVLLFEIFSSRALGWAHALLFYAGLIVEVVNAFTHTADGWTAVMPMGLMLSVIGAALMIAAAVTLLHTSARSVEYRRV